MSIRLREINGTLIAICAARSIPKPGDRYIDDAEHYALMLKFAQDLQGHIPSDLIVRKLTEQEESNNPNRIEWDKTFGDCSSAT